MNPGERDVILTLVAEIGLDGFAFCANEAAAREDPELRWKAWCTTKPEIHAFGQTRKVCFRRLLGALQESKR